MRVASNEGQSKRHARLRGNQLVLVLVPRVFTLRKIRRRPDVGPTDQDTWSGHCSAGRVAAKSPVPSGGFLGALASDGQRLIIRMIRESHVIGSSPIWSCLLTEAKNNNKACFAVRTPGRRRRRLVDAGKNARDRRSNQRLRLPCRRSQSIPSKQP